MSGSPLDSGTGTILAEVACMALILFAILFAGFRYG